MAVFGGVVEVHQSLIACESATGPGIRWELVDACRPMGPPDELGVRQNDVRTRVRQLP
jgi:hypothetical protein